MKKPLPHDACGLVKQLYKENCAAKRYFDAAAGRTRDANFTTIDRVAQISRVSRHQAVQLARLLEAIDCAKLLVGRRGRKTRIVWTYSLFDLTKAALSARPETYSPKYGDRGAVLDHTLTSISS